MPVFHLRERTNEESGGINQSTWAEIRGLFYSEFSCPHGFVVVADDELSARQIAKEEDDADSATRWLDETATACERIDPNGNSRVVIGDWPTG